MDGEAMLVDTTDLLERPVYGDEEPHWLHEFEHGRYDWCDPMWLVQNEACADPWCPLVLSSRGKGDLRGKYFTIISCADYAAATMLASGPTHWNTNIQYDRRGEIQAAYARRTGRKGEPNGVYLHRQLLDVLDRGAGVVIDHKNGWQLDNRRSNLHRAGSHAENDCNKTQRRTVNLDLPVGVRRLKSGLYYGELWVRVDGKRERIKSGTWDIPELASGWYKEQLVARYGRHDWVHCGSTKFPLFPPLLESEISEESWRLRKLTQKREPELEEIPF